MSATVAGRTTTVAFCSVAVAGSIGALRAASSSLRPSAGLVRLGVDRRLGGLGDVDRDPAGLGLLRDRQAQREHIVGVAGVAALGVEALAQEQLAAEGPLRTLTDEQLHTIEDSAVTLGVDRQHVLLDDEVDRARVDTGEVELDDELVAMAVRVDRHRALFTLSVFNPSVEALETFLGSDFVLPSLGDAGAHVGQVMDAGWTSFVLPHWVRDAPVHRRRGHPPPDRGARLGPRPHRPRPGRGRDASRLNVIDLDNVAERHPEFVHDFPGGHGRFAQRSVGYRASICNGTLIATHGDHTGERAGRVL